MVLSPLLVLVAAFLPLIFGSVFLAHAGWERRTGVADALAGKAPAPPGDHVDTRTGRIGCAGLASHIAGRRDGLRRKGR